jgi:hypothetical protein
VARSVIFNDDELGHYDLNFHWGVWRMSRNSLFQQNP